MIKIYGMETCPDCIYVEEQVKGNDNYEVIDIGQHVRNLKEFLAMRDNSPAFEKVRQYGTVGIPCFVLEDGTITLSPEKAGLHRRPKAERTAGDAQAATGISEHGTTKAAGDTPIAPSCNIDGTGC